MKVVTYALIAQPAVVLGQQNVGSFTNRARSQGPIVDLGYAQYQGYVDSTYQLNVWKGVRYAAAPIGKLRWQAPTAPEKNNTAIIQATAQPPLCPQTGASQLPPIYGFGSGLGNEDCLFLNVYAPPGAKDLPVFFWIHGGGYGLFGATYDPAPMISTNNNGFVAVIIQYRLGAFGYLGGEQVHQHGKNNAGLLDQNFALQWVQKHISKFGGDPKKVTIGGESSGAGSVMLQAMAYGGGDKYLFNNIIAASPYIGGQYKYNDPEPISKYEAFASAAGCSNGLSRNDEAVFDCLVAADSAVLQNASAKVSESGAFGTFAFIPTTDGEFVQQRPSQQLLQKRVNGKRVLSGNNANEGVPLSPPTITTPDQFMSYIHTAFPLFTQADTERLLKLYQYENVPVDPNAPKFDTLGDQGPTALSVSEFGTGLQQKVYDIYAESTFVCPSYWLAEAYTDDRESWKYQYSVTPAYHGADLSAYFSRGATVPTEGFRTSFQKLWGAFIIKNSPIISIADASANANNATVPHGNDGNIAWPSYSAASPTMMNLNTTGGQLFDVVVTPNLSFFLRFDPGVTADFRLVNADTWEGGRGARCRFWREVSSRVPE